MKSMTGFGYSEYQDRSLRLTTEIKSYNNKYLDINVNLPPFISPLEPLIREFIGNSVKRGRVEVTLRIRELQEELEVLLDEGLVRAYSEALKKAALLAGVADELFLPALVHMDGVLKVDKNRDTETFWSIIKPELEKAFQQFEESRQREGENTRQDVLTSLQLIARRLEEIEGYAGTIEERIRESLKQRFEEVLAGQVDENRVLSETAVLLVKLSIHEEIVRLRGHLETFTSVLGTDDGQGKKLDFICQELNREINTIGSKNTILEVSQIVVDIKDSIEKIREQLRNVE